MGVGVTVPYRTLPYDPAETPQGTIHVTKEKQSLRDSITAPTLKQTFHEKEQQGRPVGAACLYQQHASSRPCHACATPAYTERVTTEGKREICFRVD